jgi:hypothetical protein
VHRTQPPKEKDQRFVRDTVLQGFALRVTQKGVKSFIVEKRINKRNVRKTLGQYPALTVEQARIEAQKFLGEVARGLDPITEKQIEEARSITLRAVKDEYLAVRKGLRPKTIGDYGSTQGPVTSKFTAFWTTCSIPGCLIGFHG